jgi:hypothetical protein
MMILIFINNLYLIYLYNYNRLLFNLLNFMEIFDLFFRTEIVLTLLACFSLIQMYF